MDYKSHWLKPGENEILKFFRSTPKGIDDCSEWDQVAKVMGYLSRRPFGYVDVEVATDALAELQPERREFWLRVGATYRDNFNRRHYRRQAVCKRDGIRLDARGME